MPRERTLFAPGQAFAGLASKAMAAITMFTLMTLCGCGTRDDSAPRADAGAGADRDRDEEATKTAIGIAQRLGQTPAAVARANIRIRQPDQDAQTFQLYLWCAPDGRVRVNATKVDVEFCSALVGADGAYTAWLPRAKLSSHGNLRDQHVGKPPAPAADPTVDAPVDGKPAAPADAHEGEARAESLLLMQLTMIAHELTGGPLPLVGPFRAGPRKDTITCPAGGGFNAEIDIDAAERVVNAKRLMDATGTTVATITYSRYKQFDEQRRPTQVRVAVAGDATDILFTIGRYDGLPAISDERMHLEPPASARDVPLDEFLQHLGD